MDKKGVVHDGVILPHGTEYNDYIVFDTKNISKPLNFCNNFIILSYKY